MGSTIGDLIHVLSDGGHNSEVPLVWNAYDIAKRAHRGQCRRSSERYIHHPVEVATIVARHGGTVPAVCAALLSRMMPGQGGRWVFAAVHCGLGATEVASW